MSFKNILALFAATTLANAGLLAQDSSNEASKQVVTSTWAADTSSYSNQIPAKTITAPNNIYLTGSSTGFLGGGNGNVVIGNGINLSGNNNQILGNDNLLIGNGNVMKGSKNGFLGSYSAIFGNEVLDSGNNVRIITTGQPQVVLDQKDTQGSTFGDNNQLNLGVQFLRNNLRQSIWQQMSQGSPNSNINNINNINNNNNIQVVRAAAPEPGVFDLSGSSNGNVVIGNNVNLAGNYNSVFGSSSNLIGNGNVLKGSNNNFLGNLSSIFGNNINQSGNGVRINDTKPTTGLFPNNNYFFNIGSDLSSINKKVPVDSPTSSKTDVDIIPLVSPQPTITYVERPPTKTTTTITTTSTTTTAPITTTTPTITKTTNPTFTIGPTETISNNVPKIVTGSSNIVINTIGTGVGTGARTSNNNNKQLIGFDGSAQNSLSGTKISIGNNASSKSQQSVGVFNPAALAQQLYNNYGGVNGLNAVGITGSNGNNVVGNEINVIGNNNLVNGKNSNLLGNYNILGGSSNNLIGNNGAVIGNGLTVVGDNVVHIEKPVKLVETASNIIP